MSAIPTFTALDFETAHGKRWSVCQIGLVRVVNGKITDKLDMLIQPPGNEYSQFNIGVHGIGPRHTAKAPTFNNVWHQIEPFIKNQDLVAHNMAFDNSCLQQVLDYYSLAKPTYQKHCTYQLFGSNLASLCKEHGIALNHHNALSDAMACAELFMIHQKRSRAANG
jgi:DNA polymerase-3 subunit epsilon